MCVSLLRRDSVRNGRSLHCSSQRVAGCEEEEEEGGSGFNSKLISGGHWELKQVVEGLIKGELMQSGTSNFGEWHTAADSGGLSSPGGVFTIAEASAASLSV